MDWLVVVQLDEFKMEVAIMAKLRHPFVCTHAFALLCLLILYSLCSFLILHVVEM